MLTSPHLAQLPRILHGFGTRHDDMAAHFPGLWPRRPVQHERHGTRIAIVEHEREDVGEADGMLTDRPGLLLAIATADCVPILLARRDGREVAALHVGWRGAQAGIVARFAELVRGRGGDPGDWIAAIGPAAHPCCYEVSAELVEDFRARCALAPEQVAPGPRRIDLPAIVRWQVKQAGIAHAGASPACTMCTLDADGRHVFHSYRRDRATRTPVVDVQWSAIAIAAR
jgi:YfiH family protein